MSVPSTSTDNSSSDETFTASDVERGFDEFFDALIGERTAGNISHDEAISFFPQEVRDRCGIPSCLS